MPTFTSGSGVGTTIQTGELDAGAVTLPKSEGHGRIYLFGPDASVDAGTWAVEANDSHFMKMIWRSSANTDADALSWQVALGSGTYTVGGLFKKGNFMGKSEIQFNDVDKTAGGYDNYDAGTVYNVLQQTTGVVIAAGSGGIIKVSLVADGKNASSSAYNITFSHLFIERTA